MTKGEYLVGINFNPSAADSVGQIKRQAADLIDLIDGIPVRGDCEQAGQITRLKSLATTAIEEAAMWAVKAATKGAPGD